MRILGVHGTLPAHRYRQAEITRAFTGRMLRGPVNAAALERFHRNAGVRTRHLVLPLEDYAALDDFGVANDAFIRCAVELGAQALADALKHTGLTPDDVDVVVAATSTGFAVPSLEARIAAEVGLRRDVVRVPLVGLGCAAGAAGVARLDDLLRGRPGDVGVLLSVELCSLTLQRDDTSVANLVGTGLFGDAAAAVVAVGEHVPARPELPDRESAAVDVLASSSVLYPDTERVMGWDVGSGGLRIVLGAEVPLLVEEHIRGDVEAFLARQGLRLGDVAWWTVHPGGPKVLEALEAALGLDRTDLQVTWDSLAAIGNVSAASVLFVLADTLRERTPPPGSYGLMLAMGPGFSSQMVLLRAPERPA